MDVKLSKFILFVTIFLFFLSSFMCQKTVVIKDAEKVISIITYKRRVCDLLDCKTLPFNTRDVKNASPLDTLREGTLLKIKD